MTVAHPYRHKDKKKQSYMIWVTISKSCFPINDLKINLEGRPALFKYADDSTIIVPLWENGQCRTELVDQFLNSLWSSRNRMTCIPTKCKEIIFRKKGFSQDIVPVSNIPQCAELSILGVTFQQNCKYSSHVRAKITKANKSLFVLGSLRKEGMSQEEVDHLFNAIVLSNFSPTLPVYGASNSDLSVIQNCLDRCMKREFMSKDVNIRDLLEKADKTLHKKRWNDPECPFFQFLPKEKNTRYNLRDTSVSVPRIYTDRFKNVFSNRIIFRYDM